MNNAQNNVIVAAISMLFHESHLDHTRTSFGWIAEIISKIKTGRNEAVTEGATLQEMKNLILTIPEYLQEGPLDAGLLLPLIRMACSVNMAMYEAIEMNILREFESDEARGKFIAAQNKFIQANSNFDEVIDEISSAIYAARNGPKTTEHLRPLFETMRSGISEYERTLTDSRDPAIVSRFDTGDADTSEGNAAFAAAAKIGDVSKGYKLGWQALNAMFNGRIVKSKMIVNTALKNNGKSLIFNIMLRQFCAYNEPDLINPTKCPTVLVYTFEDTLAEKLLFIHRNIVENINGEMPDLSYYANVSVDTLRVMVTEALAQNGWRVIFQEVKPLEWNYLRFCHDVNRYKRLGYEICLVATDYLMKIPTNGIVTSKFMTTGDDVRMMYENVRDSVCQDGTIFFTPHQMNTMAKRAVQSGIECTAKAFAGKDAYAGSQQIGNVMDYGICHAKNTFNNVEYMAIALDKYRVAGEVVPIANRYFLLPFNPKGSILDDVGKDNIASSVLGGGPIGSANEHPPHAVW
ncbi:MAG: DnaB family ATPase [Betaproteobacteria bacterium]